jgi:hypothetical protein
MSFSNLCISEFVITKLVSSAYKTGLAVSDMFGRSLTYKRNSRGPSMDPRGSPSVTDCHSE